MISYSLACRDCGHRFSSWFANSGGYATLAASGLLECPACAGHGVEKALMTPAVARPAPHPKPQTAGSAAPDASSGNGSDLARMALRAMRRIIEQSAEDVGPRFADEARRMHAGEIPARPVYGQATAREVAELRDAEIPLLAVPWVADHS